MHTKSAELVSHVTRMVQIAEILMETRESDLLCLLNQNPRQIDGKSTKIDITTIPASMDLIFNGKRRRKMTQKQAEIRQSQAVNRWKIGGSAKGKRVKQGRSP